MHSALNDKKKRVRCVKPVTRVMYVVKRRCDIDTDGLKKKIVVVGRYRKFRWQVKCGNFRLCDINPPILKLRGNHKFRSPHLFVFTTKLIVFFKRAGN